jgi:hypothetical protein
MIQVSVDFNKIIGKIKIMHAVGQPPFAPGRLNIDFSYMHYLSDAGIPYSPFTTLAGRLEATVTSTFLIYSVILTPMKTIPRPTILPLPTSFSRP